MRILQNNYQLLLVFIVQLVLQQSTATLGYHPHHYNYKCYRQSSLSNIRIASFVSQDHSMILMKRQPQQQHLTRLQHTLLPVIDTTKSIADDSTVTETIQVSHHLLQTFKSSNANRIRSRTTMRLTSDPATNMNMEKNMNITEIVTTTTTTTTSSYKFINDEIKNWTNNTILSSLLSSNNGHSKNYFKLPPFDVEDWDVLYYDIFLLINLVISISFYVVYRYNISYLSIAFNEGCLLSLCWIVSGLLNGAFLYSAIDGHQTTSITKNRNRDRNTKLSTNTTATPSMDDGTYWNRGGPIGAGLLAFHTFINTMNIRLIIAFIDDALIHHRMVLMSDNELLIPLEFSYGIILMILWRSLHSSYIPRL